MFPAAYSAGVASRFGCQPFIEQYRVQQTVAPLTIGINVIADATFIDHAEPVHDRD
jgi:hypothetical protein